MADTKLAEARKEIDRIDAEMAALFEARFAAVRNVISYKMAHGLPVLDTGREEEIRNRNAARITDPGLRKYYRQWFDRMLTLSKEYQEEIRSGNDGRQES